MNNTLDTISSYLLEDKLFYEIPLIIISNGNTEKEKIQNIKAYSYGIISEQLINMFSEEEIYDYYKERRHIWEIYGFLSFDYSQFPFFLVMSKFHYSKDDDEIYKELYSKYVELKRNVSQYEQKYSKDMIVSVPIEICQEVLVGKFKYDDLAVLIAIYSAIGKTNEKRRITIEQISSRMNGYKSIEIHMKEGGKILENKEYHRIRRITEKLAERGFYSRITYKNRITEYSTRLTPEQLQKRMLDVRVKRIEKKVKPKRLANQMNNAIDELKSRINQSDKTQCKRSNDNLSIENPKSTNISNKASVDVTSENKVSNSIGKLQKEKSLIIGDLSANMLEDKTIKLSNGIMLYPEESLNDIPEILISNYSKISFGETTYYYHSLIRSEEICKIIENSNIIIN